MPHRFLRAIEPIVAHGVQEMQLEGATLEHTLRQVTLMGALVGAGTPTEQAIRQVEALEPQLLGTFPGEAMEPYHRAPFDKGGFGKGMGGYGKGMGPVPFGKGPGYGKMGKQMPTPWPMGYPMMPGAGVSPFGAPPSNMMPYMGGFPQ